MKRLVLSVVLVAALVGFSVFGSVTVKKKGGEISEMLDGAISAAEKGDMAEAKAAAKRIEDLFVEAENTLALFLDHEIVNKLGADISQLYYLADKETKNDFSAYCRSAKITVTHIMASETPTLSNVL